MSKPRKPTTGQPKDRGPVLYMRLDDDTEAAIKRFIDAQVVAPDRTAVGLTAIHEFLAKHGFWPPKK